MRTTIGVLLMLLAIPAMADETIVISYDPDQPGKYLLEVVVSADGTAEVGPLAVDYSLTDPTPDPTPDPDPVDLTERAKEIRDAALSVTGDLNREKTAQILAGAYQGIASKIRDGELTGDKIAPVLKMTGDLILNTAKVKPNWQPVRDVLSAQWVDLAQLGGSDGDYAELLDEAADGLYASAPSQPELDLSTILEIVSLVMELLDGGELDMEVIMRIILLVMELLI
jgi:hypothetical protein